jgi:hypothetical protein
VAKMMMEPGRTWVCAPGASLQSIHSLVQASPWPIPAAILDLLTFSDGGEGDLPMDPFCFVLDRAEEIEAGLEDCFLLERFPGFLFIGGDGGLGRIALDCRSQPPFPVVAIDPIAGPGSAQQVARDADEFVDVLGLATSDRTPDDA